MLPIFEQFPVSSLFIHLGFVGLTSSMVKTDIGPNSGKHDQRRTTPGGDTCILFYVYCMLLIRIQRVDSLRREKQFTHTFLMGACTKSIAYSLKFRVIWFRMENMTITGGFLWLSGWVGTEQQPRPYLYRSWVRYAHVTWRHKARMYMYVQINIKHKSKISHIDVFEKLLIFATQKSVVWFIAVIFFNSALSSSSCQAIS